MKIDVVKDGEGFLARVIGQDNIFAYGTSELDAKKELVWVVEMMMDYHLEQVENERQIKNAIIASNELEYAV